MGKSLIVYPTKNQRKNDAKGAFIPEALAFARRRVELGDDVDSFAFDPHTHTRDDNIKLYAQIAAGQYSTVAIFSHGVAIGLPQLHISRGDCKAFAAALTTNAPSVRVILYACLTALPLQNARNFAETLAAELHAIGKPFTLVAHRTAGHTTHNPAIQIYRGAIDWVFKPDAKRLADPRDPYRFDFPFEV